MIETLGLVNRENEQDYVRGEMCAKVGESVFADYFSPCKTSDLNSSTQI